VLEALRGGHRRLLLRVQAHAPQHQARQRRGDHQVEALLAPLRLHRPAQRRRGAVSYYGGEFLERANEFRVKDQLKSRKLKI